MRWIKDIRFILDRPNFGLLQTDLMKTRFIDYTILQLWKYSRPGPIHPLQAHLFSEDRSEIDRGLQMALLNPNLPFNRPVLREVLQTQFMRNNILPDILQI